MKNTAQNFKKRMSLQRQEEIKEIQSLTLTDRIRITEKLLSETPPVIPKIKDRSIPVALSALLKNKKNKRAR